MGQLLPKNIDLIVFSYSRRSGQAAHAAPSEQQRTAYAEATVGGWIAAEKARNMVFCQQKSPPRGRPLQLAAHRPGSPAAQRAARLAHCCSYPPRWQVAGGPFSIRFLKGELLPKFSGTLALHALRARSGPGDARESVTRCDGKEMHRCA